MYIQTRTWRCSAHDNERSQSRVESNNTPFPQKQGIYPHKAISIVRIERFSDMMSAVVARCRKNEHSRVADTHNSDPRKGRAQHVRIRLLLKLKRSILQAFENSLALGKTCSVVLSAKKELKGSKSHCQELLPPTFADFACVLAPGYLFVSRTLLTHDPLSELTIVFPLNTVVRPNFGEGELWGVFRHCSLFCDFLTFDVRMTT
jgi:hypothetical protein